MGYIGSFIFGIVQLAAIVLISVGIPLAMMQPSKKELNFDNNYCITMWGIREHCMRSGYAYKPADVWSNCTGRVGRFKAAQICAIAAIAIFAVSFVLSLLLSCCCPCISYMCMMLNFAAMIVVTVSWGSMLDCYLRKMGSDTTSFSGQDVCVRLKDFHGTDGTYVNGMHLGTGFILILVGWACGLTNIFVLLIPF